MNTDIRNLAKWLNEEQTAPIDRQALARVLAMAEQPAPQEPVAWLDGPHLVMRSDWRDRANYKGPWVDFGRAIPDSWVPVLYTSPQAQPAPEIAIADAYRAGVDSGIAAEREACAMACEAHKINGQLVHSNAVVGCAAAIRARGNT